MKRYLSFVLIVFLLGLLGGCTDNDAMIPAWKIVSPRILAIAVDEPVFAPGDEITFSALIADLDVTERGGSLAEWTLGNTLKSVSLDGSASFTVPAADDIDLFFGATAQGDYIATGRAAVQVHLTVRLADGRTLLARKDLLLVSPSVKEALQYENPSVKRILVTVPGVEGLSVEPGATVDLPDGLQAERISLAAVLKESSVIEKYRYRWYLEPTTASEKVALYGDLAVSSVELTVPRLAPVRVHLVIEDASEEEKTTPYHGGVAFLSFMVTIGDGPNDDDSSSPDEDALSPDA